ncbi:unnamed protein product [Rotaria socialis]|uniref:Uncharacterized protein n=1 Tax=Rotaria socialis TaxID=392032 RepID=A0A820ZVU3_9BILA|nr:unnamed protein product [Rotaria socialis]
MMDSTGDLALWVGKRQVSIDIYVDWCNNSLEPFFDLDMDNVWNRSMVPLITWEITDCNHSAEDDPGITKKINNNTFDPYINQFGDRLKKWLAGPDGIYGTYDDRRAFVRLGMEFNDIAQAEKGNAKEPDNSSIKKSKINDNTTNMHGICHDYWKPTIPSYSEMNTRIRGIFTIQPFANGKYEPDQSENLEKHQESTYHKITVQILSFKLANYNDIQALLKHSQLPLIQSSDIRWLSYSHTINAVIRCYERLIVPFQFESTVFNIIKQQCPNDFNNDLFTEWKIFRKYLSTQQGQQTSTI